MKQYAVGFFRNENNDILLLRRSWSAPWMDYKWSLPGGTVEPSETPLNAFVREVKEEMLIDILPTECYLKLIVKEKTDEGEFEVFYYEVLTKNFKEEDIILNFENDKYCFIDLNKEIEDTNLIPNLDVVLEYLRDESVVVQGNVDNITIKKSFVDLIQPNPYQLGFEKGMDTGKLHLKDIVDKLGRHIKKWVRNEQPEAGEKKEKKEDVATENKKSSDFDYHSVYKDSKILESHAKNSSSEDLKKFIDSESGNKNASNLVSAAKNELKNRGESTEPSDKNPYGEDKKSKEEKPKEKTQEPDKPKEVKEEPKKEKKEDPRNWDMNASQSQKVEPDEKPKTEKHIDKLTSEGKTFDQKPKEDKESAANTQADEATAKEEKAEVKEEKKPYDPKKDPKAIKNSEGNYNPETLEGWDGDNSLPDKSKKQATEMDDHLKKVVSNIIDSNKKGDLEIVEGDGGLGKTFEVLQQMKEKGLKEVSMDDKTGRGENSKGKFVHLKGDISPAKFYEVLHDYPYSKIIVDDVGKILKDPQGLEMIKAATDTSSNTVTRGRSGGAGDDSKRKKLEIDLDDANSELESLKDEDGDIKSGSENKVRKLESKIKKLKVDHEELGDKRSNQVDFKGQMLIISNRLPTDNHKLKEEFYDPLVTRTKSGKINTLRMGNEAKLYKLSKLIPFFSGRTDATTGKPAKLTGTDRKTTYDYIKKLVKDNKVDDISMRMMGSVSDQIQDLKKNGTKDKDIPSELDKLYYSKIQKALSPEMIQHFENLILGL